jgi:aspartyl-tRNA(Asn)/glutamyl-tRNA(Gln) amidotransferase subunit A
VESSVQAFVSVHPDDARQQAHAWANAVAAGAEPGPLHGMPVAIKDIFDVAGRVTRCGSRAYDNAPVAVSDSAAVRRLREAGAVIIGKSRTHELALGVSTPPTRNPWDLTRSPGGSSGGSGAAVAAGMAVAALGSDTGGSVRTPASLCGVVGLKPTYGRISRAGALPLSWSLDHVGVLARTVGEAAVLLQVLAGPDLSDPATLGLPTLEIPHIDGSTVGRLAGRRFGIVPEAFLEAMDQATATGFANARSAAERAGATCITVSVPELSWSLEVEMTILLTEAAAFHERRLATQPTLFSEGVLSPLTKGLSISSPTYLRAQRVRAVIQAAVARAFTDHQLDALIAPSTPSTAHRVEQEVLDLQGTAERADEAYVRTTGPANLCGLPAVALPVEMSRAGLPVSVQLIGRAFSEPDLLPLAAAFHDITAWGAAWRQAPCMPTPEARP